ncbi:MAG: ATP-binding protein [Actinomycetota bacterium]|nr:ATP-binding protein [Actinomycetota bacterium]
MSAAHTKTISLLGAIRTDWREIGGLGRFALVGIGIAAAVTVVLGFSITATVRNQLLSARAALIETSVADLPEFPLDRPATLEEFARFDAEVRRRVLGSDTVRVKLWTPQGTIVYSDAGELVGQTFELSAAAQEAFSGDTGTTISDLRDDAHAFDRDEGELIEYYVPLPVGSGGVSSVIEVEQDITEFNDALGRITRNVWLSISIGLTVLGVFIVTLAAARARELNQRRRQAELLLRSSFHAQEEERQRIVGSLHDDVGQPLYRLLYGLEGVGARLGDRYEVAADIADLQGIVRDVDKTLRRELRLLHQGMAEDTGLDMALADLVEMTQRETDLTITTSIDLAAEPSAVQLSALYRAAQEAVTNVRKHANAREVHIDIHQRDGRTVLHVDDDGVGHNGETGLGLTTTRERFEALGGSIAVSEKRDRGTRFVAWLPAAPGVER